MELRKMAAKPYSPQALPLSKLDWKRFLRLIGPANAALARYDGILQAMINPGVLLSPLTTQEAVLSSRIEGTQATLEEVLQFEARYDDDLERNQDIREIINYRSAIHAAVESLRNRPICLNLFKEIHSILLDSVRGRDKARGEFRRVQNFIGAPKSSIDQAVFVPPKPLSLEKQVRNLENYIHRKKQQENHDAFVLEVDCYN
jgi:Fic family protein